MNRTRDQYLLEDKTIGFIGGGNMAQAIGLGLVKKELIKANQLLVSSRTEKTLEIWKEFGANVTLDNNNVVVTSDVVFICVKPQVFETALGTCKPLTAALDKGQLFISVMVGITIDSLYQQLKRLVKCPKIVRSLPSTPVLVSEGIVVYCSTSNILCQEELIVKALFSQIGICEEISESLMNSAGALTGSGPAYAYLIIEALADGAVKKGIPREVATRFAAQVLVGAGQMVLRTGKHPGQLKDEVCSPNGSTITGIHAMESGGVRAAMMNAIEAASNRSDELGKLLSN